MSTSDPIRIGVRELRSNLTRYLGQVRRGGSILVTSRGTVVAEIKPPQELVRSARVPGALKGEIWMADDFDTWPRDVLDTFES